MSCCRGCEGDKMLIDETDPFADIRRGSRDPFGNPAGSYDAYAVPGQDASARDPIGGSSAFEGLRTAGADKTIADGGGTTPGRSRMLMWLAVGVVAYLVLVK